MSEPKFTPRCWEVWRHDNTRDPGFAWIQVIYRRETQPNYKVCQMDTLHPLMSPSERETIIANAHLIAAAPEMYAFLEWMKKLIDGAKQTNDYSLELEVSAGVSLLKYDLDRLLARARGEVQ